MGKRLELAQDRFFAGIGRISDAFGLNRFVVQLYALLYFRSEPMSLEDIANALGVSKGNVSINVRELEKWGAVKHVWVKGSRKDYYEAEPDVRKVFLNKVKSAVERRTAEFSELLDEFDKALELNNKEGLSAEEARKVSIYAERLKRIKDMKNTIMSVVELVNKFI